MTTPIPRQPTLAVLRRGTAYGLLWSVGIDASEALALPFGPLDSLDKWLALWPIFVGWALGGAAMGYGVVALEAQLDRAWKLVAFVAAASLGVAAFTQACWLGIKAVDIDISTPRLIGNQLPSWDNFIYAQWMTMTHGGLFIVACVFVLRAERHRRLLAQSQIARGRTEALLDEAQIDALRGQLDPAFMLRAMAAIQQRYASDPPAADRLLDQLVEFLRAAMPGLRSGASTLQAEVALARAYARLGAAIDAGYEAHGGRWQVEVRGRLPEMPFPPLLLLPLMDHFGTPCQLWVGREHGQLCITFISAGAAALPGALQLRVRVALQSTFGHAFSLGAEPGSALTLRAGKAQGPAPPPTHVVATHPGALP